ncbi:MAG TPA: helix-hairpin-helix domain-containing protein [Bryobacteraceae bacterium]|nr:helix-hairpin-helix domain-containing protein [Bryobacteraceae bacterium]
MLLLILIAGLAQDLPDGPGKETVLKLCQDCHDLGMVTMDNRTREGWQKTVTKMGERGAEVSDDQFETIVAYLTTHFGRINVNKASAAEIAAGAGFSEQEAVEIVKYRDKNGEFKDWKDLKKVVDPAKVEAKKDHIALK